ncbi:MAG: ribosome biogenesis GTPase Der [Bacteroidetes bacterium]|nr:ribosome biogenesis GTPase Der [Bacteroidota bacterium]
MSLPVIAIVGRPNVGKSTLFNRLLGRREAIVHDMPGVTRDRHVADGEWAGKAFTLIDTGGFVPESKDDMEVAIREQSRLAIAQADHIVFVVDVQTGITRHDEAIADELRKSEKKVTVCVNKVDDNNKLVDTHVFIRLGLGEPYGLSAGLGYRIGDFLDLITEDTGNREVVEDERLKLAVVGRPNVGKSSFVNAILGEDRQIVSPVSGTTRDSIDTVLKYYSQEIVLIDTAGLRKKAKVTESVEFFSNVRTQRAMERSDVVVLLVDAQEGLLDQDMRIIVESVKLGRGLVLCVNKWDLLEKDNKTYKTFEDDIRKKLGTNAFIPILFISALTKQRIYKVIDLAKQVQADRGRKIPTSKLNEFFLPVIQKTPPPAVQAKEIRIKYVTQVSINPPVIAFFTNHSKLIPDSYKRFMDRSFREHFGFAGVPVRFVFKEKNKKQDK